MRRTRHRSEICVRSCAKKFLPARNNGCTELSKIPVPRALSFEGDSHSRRRHPMEKVVTISTHLQPIVALVAGVLILIMPRLLNYIVALYLILVGILGLGLLK